jgi:hypothetical protein
MCPVGTNRLKSKTRKKQCGVTTLRCVTACYTAISRREIAYLCANSIFRVWENLSGYIICIAGKLFLRGFPFFFRLCFCGENAEEKALFIYQM